MKPLVLRAKDQITQPSVGTVAGSVDYAALIEGAIHRVLVAEAIRDERAPQILDVELVPGSVVHDLLEVLGVRQL